MATKIFAAVSSLIITVISSSGYLGIGFLMAVQNANIPIPSEIIMPFAGYLATTGRFDFWAVVAVGTIGCIVGSAFSYWLGKVGGRPLILRYGKYFLVTHHDLDLADKWFSGYGEATVCFSRILPIIRTFISFPAGISKMNFYRFIIYTTIGSFAWTLGLAYIGLRLGGSWETIKVYFHRFDTLILILLIALVVWWIIRHINLRRKDSKYEL
jgi:membrane protein DedA with SNARE-associated domain